jgi:hypothetical protein
VLSQPEQAHQVVIAPAHAATAEKFTARSDEVGTRSWTLVSNDDGTVLAGGVISIAAAPSFKFLDIPVVPGSP